jgi:GTP-binding protein
LDQLPHPGAPEVCFVGRSNAGKSTAINVLANQKRLAFSSKTPGRTRLINMFGLPDPLDPEGQLGFLVDLPGYGYASVAHRAREEWADILGGYLQSRESLAGIVLLIDIRRGVTELDRRLANWIAPLAMARRIRGPNPLNSAGNPSVEATLCMLTSGFLSPPVSSAIDLTLITSS